MSGRPACDPQNFQLPAHGRGAVFAKTKAERGLRRAKTGNKRLVLAVVLYYNTLVRLKACLFDKGFLTREGQFRRLGGGKLLLRRIEWEK